MFKRFLSLLKSLARCVHFFRLGYESQVLPVGDSRIGARP